MQGIAQTAKVLLLTDSVRHILTQNSHDYEVEL